MFQPVTDLEDAEHSHTMDLLSNKLEMDYALAEAKSSLSHLVPNQCDVILANKSLQISEKLEKILAVGFRQKRTLCGCTVIETSLNFCMSLLYLAHGVIAFRVYCTHLDVGTEEIRMQQLNQIFEALEDNSMV